MLAGFEASHCLQIQILCFDLLGVLEGVLEVNGELGPGSPLLHGPGERAVEARLVLATGPAARAVGPSAGAVCGLVGERVRVVDSEDHGDVGGLHAVDDEVSDLEGVASELLVVDNETLGRWESEDGDEEEGEACNEGVEGLHYGGVVLAVAWCMRSRMRW
jgi:hypothetical protein